MYSVIATAISRGLVRVHLGGGACSHGKSGRFAA